MADYSKRPDDPLFVDDKLTFLSEEEMTYALREAYYQVLGSYPSIDSLAILWAQVCLETNRGKSLHCWNYGNSKKLPNIKYTSFKCNEYINGKLEWFYPFHPQTFFAAWDNATEGAIAYLKFLTSKSRYKAAWEQVQKGDPTAYSKALKAANYYTAHEEDFFDSNGKLVHGYTWGVVSLCNEFKRKADKLLAWKPPVEPPPLPSPEPSQPLPEPPPISSVSDSGRPSQLPTVVPEEDIVPASPIPPPFPETKSNGLLDLLLKLFQFLRNLF